MLTISDLKIGTKIIYQEKPYQVILAQHSKLGRGGAILRTKLKNLLDGSVVEKTFAGAEKIKPADLETCQAQFLYHDDKNAFFMNLSDFDQFELALDKIQNQIKFLKEGTKIDILYFQEKPVSIQMSIKIQLKVTYTEPGFKGNTASATTKPATLETGAQIQVPLFIKEDDKIVVDTKTGEYVSRA